MVCLDNHFVRYSCSVDSVIRQAAVMLGDLERFDFVAEQRLLPCATKDAVLRNKGVGGCARRQMGYGKLQGKKCAPFKREVCTSS